MFDVGVMLVKGSGTSVITQYADGKEGKVEIWNDVRGGGCCW